ncbi:hypothetical protein C1646_666446 [Rhizophagus diaphanus]|nr:hypothetical protein C1646_666446 [Rhizophagus diaphanus] [Rhizophagus sp. MUCL 43196]
MGVKKEVKPALNEKNLIKYVSLTGLYKGVNGGQKNPEYKELDTLEKVLKNEPDEELLKRDHFINKKLIKTVGQILEDGDVNFKNKSFTHSNCKNSRDIIGKFFQKCLVN